MVHERGKYAHLQARVGSGTTSARVRLSTGRATASVVVRDTWTSIETLEMHSPKADVQIGYPRLGEGF